MDSVSRPLDSNLSPPSEKISTSLNEEICTMKSTPWRTLAFTRESGCSLDTQGYGMMYLPSTSLESLDAGLLCTCIHHFVFVRRARWYYGATVCYYVDSCMVLWLSIADSYYCRDCVH